MTTAALYARVSTDEQNVAMQIDALHAACTSRGLQWTDYIDHGESGAKERRPALDRMLTACRKGEHTVVVVWKIDRLSRSLAHLLLTLDSLTAWGVGFISLTDSGLDTTTPHGRLLTQILGAFAEFERSLIQARIKTGLARAKVKGTKSGKPIGRPPVDLDVESARIALKVHGSERKAALALGVSRTALQRRLAAGRAGERTVGV